MIRARDLLERVVWTFVSGFLGSLIAAPILLDVIENVADQPLDVSRGGAALIAAAFAGFTAAANVVLIIARWRLSILPDPGAGLPGFDTSDAGYTRRRAQLVLATAVALVVLLV